MNDLNQRKAIRQRYLLRSRLMMYINLQLSLHHQSLYEVCRKSGYAGGYITTQVKDVHRNIHLNIIHKIIPYLNVDVAKSVLNGNYQPITDAFHTLGRRVNSRASFRQYLYLVIYSHGMTFTDVASALGKSSKGIPIAIKSDSLKYVHDLCQKVAKVLGVKEDIILKPLSQVPKGQSSSNLRRDLIYGIHNNYSLYIMICTLAHHHGMSIGKLNAKANVSIQHEIWHRQPRQLMPLVDKIAPYLGLSYENKDTIRHKLRISPYPVIVCNRPQIKALVKRYLNLLACEHHQKISNICVKRGYSSNYFTEIFSRAPVIVFKRIKNLMPYVSYRDVKDVSRGSTVPFSETLARIRAHIVTREDFGNYVYAICITKGSTFRNLSRKTGHNTFFVRNTLQSGNPRIALKRLPTLAKGLHVKPRILVDPLKKLLRNRPGKSQIISRIHNRRSLLHAVHTLGLWQGYSNAQISRKIHKASTHVYGTIIRGTHAQIRQLMIKIHKYLGVTMSEGLQMAEQAPDESSRKKKRHDIPSLRKETALAVKLIAKKSWMSVTVLSKTLYHNPDKISNVVKRDSYKKRYSLLKNLVASSGVKDSKVEQTLTKLKRSSQH